LDIRIRFQTHYFAGYSIGRVANLAFFKPAVEILAFFERLWLSMEMKKKPDKI